MDIIYCATQEHASADALSRSLCDPSLAIGIAERAVQVASVAKEDTIFLL